jgi:hypothetical protein
MSVFATSTNRFSQVVKHEYEPSLAFCRDVIVINDVAATLKTGAVLGKVTATGKYKLVDSAAVDGSQNAAAVIISDNAGMSRDITIAAATDTTVVAITRGPVIVAKESLSFAANVNSGQQVTALAQLKALGILAETQL